MAKELRETCLNFIEGEKTATFYTAQRKWITKIKKYAETHPEVSIRTENKDGSVVAHVPMSWFKLSPPKTRNYTEEQRAALAQRLSSARQAAIKTRSNFNDKESDDTE